MGTLLDLVLGSFRSLTGLLMRLFNSIPSATAIVLAMLGALLSYRIVIMPLMGGRVPAGGSDGAVKRFARRARGGANK